MRRQVWVLNFVLMAIAVALAIKLKGDWQQANRRYEPQRAERAASAGPTGPSAPAVLSAGHEAIVQANLFSPDRLPELPKAAAEKKPPPPEPLLIGTMNLGPGRSVALLQENSSNASPRTVKPGEEFGGYKVVSVGENQVELEYEGQKKKIDVVTSARQIAAPPQVASAPAAAAAPQVISTGSAPASSPQTSNIAPPAGGGPGNPVPGTSVRFAGKDNLPAGTIVNGWRKVVRQTPFGNQEWWEQVKPEERKP